MMTRDADKKREQMMMFSMDDMVPKDHMLRKIDRAIDWNFIYDLVEDKYCADNGRPSMDPVMLIKIPFIQYLYGIKSMRQTIKEIEVNVAYRWFLGLDMLDPVPHFSTFGKNYTRRFKDTELFEQIFSHILEQCMKFHLVDTSTVFVDSTHVKACANSKKMRKRIASQEALWYEEELKKEINEDRKNHGMDHGKNTDRMLAGSQGTGLSYMIALFINTFRLCTFRTIANDTKSFKLFSIRFYDITFINEDYGIGWYESFYSVKIRSSCRGRNTC